MLAIYLLYPDLRTYESSNLINFSMWHKFRWELVHNNIKTKNENRSKINETKFSFYGERGLVTKDRKISITRRFSNCENLLVKIPVFVHYLWVKGVYKKADEAEGSVALY